METPRPPWRHAWLAKKSAPTRTGAFEFLMTEAALRYRPGPREVLTAQLDHLAVIVTLETRPRRVPSSLTDSQRSCNQTCYKLHGRY